MPSYVLDASVAIKWVLPEAGQDLALSLLERADTLLAPGLLLVEAANVFWLRQRRGLLSTMQAARALDLLAASLDIHPEPLPLLHDAMEFAAALDHPIYDCLYLALAKQQGLAMVSEDKRLRAKLAGTPWHGLVLGLNDAAGQA